MTTREIAKREFDALKLPKGEANEMLAWHFWKRAFDRAYQLISQSADTKATCSKCGNTLTDKERYYETCLACGETIEQE